MPHLEVVFDFFNSPVLDHTSRIGVVAFAAGLQRVYILHNLHKNLHKSRMGIESLEERTWCPRRWSPNPFVGNKLIVHLSW